MKHNTEEAGYTDKTEDLVYDLPLLFDNQRLSN